MHGRFRLLARFGQDRLDVRLADDLAHGALGDFLHGVVRVLDVEQVLGRILDAPVDDEVDVDGVLVAGQHQAFFLDVLRAAAEAAIEAVGRAHADLDDVLARDLGEHDLLDRIRQAEVQARRLLAHELAEAHDDAELVGVDAEEERVPGDDGARPRRSEEDERTGNAAAVHHLLHAVLAALQHVLEVGGLAARSLAPRAAAAFPAAATATALIAPGHIGSPLD